MLLERWKKMKEYRVMYNCYDGQGDIEYEVTNDQIHAIELRYVLEEGVLIKGRAWIEVREVSSWKRIEIR